MTFHEPEFDRREMTLLSSPNPTARDFGRVMDLMEHGRLDISPWRTHQAGSQKSVEAFPHWIELGASVIKALIEW